jgi:hypothetical protein
MLLFRYPRVLKTAGGTPSEPGLSRMSSITVPTYTIMSNDLSLIVEEDFSLFHVDAVEQRFPLE